MADRLAVLVTGATGQQGGHVARVLLEKGHRVRALTRQPDSAAARELAALGAEPIAGDFEDAASIERAARGADAMFLMSTPFEAGVDVEERQGLTGADAAKAAGVGHLVYSSVANADQHTGIPHFESKHRVEEHIAGLGVSYTIVGPVAFMENLLAPPNLDGLRRGELAQALPASRPLQQIPLEDVADFLALVLERADEFRGVRIDIASDELTGNDLAEIVSRHAGRALRYVETSTEQVRAWSEDAALMFEWFDRVGYSVDIARLRADYPEVGWHTFDDWARQQDWSALLGPDKAERVLR